MAVLHDPLANVMLDEFLSGIVNCKNDAEKVEFLKSLTKQKNCIKIKIAKGHDETMSDDDDDTLNQNSINPTIKEELESSLDEDDVALKINEAIDTDDEWESDNDSSAEE